MKIGKALFTGSFFYRNDLARRILLVPNLGNALISRLALNQATGVLSVVITPIGDAIGYRRLMLAALTISAVGMLAGGAFPFFGMVLVALFLVGLGKSIFDPALQAYIGKQVPFERREPG